MRQQDCVPADAPVEPSLIGLDPGTRALILEAAERGAVAVRYEATACEPRLEVLTDCVGAARYEFTPHAGVDATSVVLAGHGLRDLPFARAWLRGAASASVERLRTGDLALPLGFISAGADFSGACSRATHVLAHFEVGGSSLTKVAPGSADGTMREGNASARQEAQRTQTSAPACSALLSAILVPLSPGSAPVPAESDEWRRLAVTRAATGQALLETIHRSGRDGQEALRRRASEAFGEAADAWSRYIAARSPLGDAYDARFLLAQARHHQVLAAQGALPWDGTKWAAALQTAEEVRDEPGPRRHLAESARFAVELAEAEVRRQEKRFEESGGSDGVAPRTELPFEGEGKDRHVVALPIPEPYLTLAHALDEYTRRVPDGLDDAGLSSSYRFRSAELHFFHGHFREARALYEPVFDRECQRTEMGFIAWERLLTMSNIEGDVARSRRLAEHAVPRGCAVTAEQQYELHTLIEPQMESDFVKARIAFEKARRLSDGPERDDAWHRAAAAYAYAMNQQPERGEVIEAAINGAHAYAQVLEYDRAIGLLERLLETHSSEQSLVRLEKGDPTTTPPILADAEAYAVRVQYTLVALQTLADLHERRADSDAALQAQLRIAEERRFPPAARKGAACGRCASRPSPSLRWTFSCGIAWPRSRASSARATAESRSARR